jgi:selenocysteine lyase/cysteine desulfurase
MTDWAAVRAEFPALEQWTYLNTATFGQVPRRAAAAIARHLAHRDELACSDFLKWFDDADRVRATMARLIGASADDIAFAGNASEALSVLLHGIPWRPGDRFLTLAGEFPNNLYAPAGLGAHGVEAVEARSWDEFLEALRGPVRLAALSSVNYTNGFRPPLDGLAEKVHAAGGLLCIDGTQSLGALCFDTAAVRPDMFAVHAYKWMLSPNGAAFFYIAPEVRAWLPPSVIGWRSHRDWRNVDQLHHGTPEFSERAEKYEGGMLNFLQLYAMEAVADMLLEIGPERIEARVKDLAGRLRETLRSLGATLLYDAQPHWFDSPIVAARWEGVDASRLAKELAARRVLVSARHGNLRVSVHLYNNEQDLLRLAGALAALLGTR